MSAATLHRISELMIRYRTRPVGNKVGVFDAETGEMLPATFDDEAMARAGARLAAAADIQALFAPGVAR